MSADLPFDINASEVGRGLFNFVARIADQRITSERYSPGDGDRRRAVAKRWAEDSRLQNGRPLDPAAIVSALEQVEFEVQDQIEAIQEQEEGVTVHEVASYCDDSTLAELAWNVEDGSCDFIVYDRKGEKLSRSRRLETSTGILGVPSICAGIVTPGHPMTGAVLVPAGCDVAGGEDEDRLRRDIREFIGRYAELPGETLSIAVEYVLLTWVFDRFDELPYVAFRTPDAGCGKSRALETVGAICYRPMLIGGGSSAAATLRMLDVFGGTLLADEFDAWSDSELASDLAKILNQGFQRGRPLVKCTGENNEPHPFTCYGPKLFALRKRLGDDATESRTISVVMQKRTRREVPINLPRAKFDAEALALRNRLLAWRFLAYDKIKLDPNLADSTLSDRANQIGVPLLSVARSPESRQRIIEALRQQEADVAADRAESLAGGVLAAIVAIYRPGDTVRSVEVTRHLNQRRAEAEGVDLDRLKHPVSSQKVAKVIRTELRLPKDDPPKDKQGARYVLDADRMEDLCQRFGVALPATSSSSPSSSSRQDSLEFGPGDSANAVGDVGDVGDVTGEPPGSGGEDDLLADAEADLNSPAAAEYRRLTGADQDWGPT